MNLPVDRYSHGLRRLATIEATRGSFDDTVDAIERASGQHVGKRQVEELVRRAAIDVDAFYAAIDRQPADGAVLLLSVDGKGIVIRPATKRGADVIGMAGGDGSQALVASVAADRDVPMVVVPAGTQNHLALDLGIDRDDVVGALDAFDAAVERPMDLAEVNGHVFVNNVSLGLYGAVVRSPEYRDAKVDTTLSTLPRLLGPGSQPMDLRFEGPDGAHHGGAHVVQVSNGPYGTTLTTMTCRRGRAGDHHVGAPRRRSHATLPRRARDQPTRSI